MLATHAFVLAVVAAPADGIGGFLARPEIIFLPAMALMFYFLLIRPQQRRAREHAAMVGAIKRGDTVVLSSGLIGKVVRVEDAEIGVEIAQNVTVKVVKAMVTQVRARGEPAPANDAKS